MLNSRSRNSHDRWAARNLSMDVRDASSQHWSTADLSTSRCIPEDLCSVPSGAGEVWSKTDGSSAGRNADSIAIDAMMPPMVQLAIIHQFRLGRAPQPGHATAEVLCSFPQSAHRLSDI